MMAPRWTPAPGKTVTLFGEKYSFQEHPNAPGMPLAAEGGRATVYKVHSHTGQRYGLKVFFRNLRNEAVRESSEHLKRLENIEGMLAASRKVVLPNDPQVQSIPDLKYAVLMPWVPGRTWYDCLSAAGERGKTLPREMSENLATRFLTVLWGLERQGLAHTDISAANVMVNIDDARVELIDLEDVYFPDRPIPVQVGPGTVYYQHRAGKTTWVPEGDRYAAAVLASEMLLLSSKDLARGADPLGFYGGTCESPDGKQRFDMAEDYLKSVAPYFLEEFRRSWNAESLADCPRINDLLAGLMKGRKTPFATPAITLDPMYTPPTVSGAEDIVVWEQFAIAPGTSRAASSTPRNQASDPVPVFWEVQGVSEHATDTSPLPTSPHVSWEDASDPSTTLPSANQQTSDVSGANAFFKVLLILAAIALILFLVVHFSR